MATGWKIGEYIQDRWEIFRIFRGGMGVVYVVYDHQLHDVCAIKTFPDYIFVDNPHIFGRLKQEALTWINLGNHPNITQALFFENIQEKPSLILEYVSGGDLGKWIGTPRLLQDLPQVLRFAVQFCDGMIYINSKAIRSHCDVKPQNCLITEDKTLKITDFGLAQAFDEDLVTNSGQGIVEGTPTHMAPEQFDGRKQFDARTDIYSFGVMLFQMVTGELPFHGRTWTEYATVHKLCPIPPLENGCVTVNQNCFRTLESVIRQCLAKDPALRFSDFLSLRVTLTEIYERLVGEPPSSPPIAAEPNARQLVHKAQSLNNLGFYEKAMECCDQSLNIAPHLTAALTTKSFSLLQLGRFQEVIEYADRAIAIEIANEIEPSNKGIALSNKGSSLKNLGKTVEALQCYEQAIGSDPYNVNAYMNKGNLLASIGQPKEALHCYDKVIEINPQDDLCWSNKAKLLHTMGKDEEALLCFDRAIEVTPYSEQVWSSKGAILSELERFEEAIVCFERALALNERNEAIWTLKAYALHQLGRLTENLFCLENALEINPNNAETWYSRGFVLVHLGQMEQAVISFDRAIEYNRTYADAWRNKGLALCNLYRYKEAVSCFEEAQHLGLNMESELAWCRVQVNSNLAQSIEHMPADIKISFSKGVDFARLSRFEEALTCFERVLQKYPDHKWALVSKAHLLHALSSKTVQKDQKVNLLKNALLCYDRVLTIDPDFAEAKNHRRTTFDDLVKYVALEYLLQNAANTQTTVDAKQADSKPSPALPPKIGIIQRIKRLIGRH